MTADRRDQLASALAERLQPRNGMSERAVLRLADALLPTVERMCAEAEAAGYERGRRDFQFAPEGDNHHNAALCPYCSPDRAGRVGSG